MVSNRVATLDSAAIGAGGLAASILAAMRDGGLWFGWTGERVDGAVGPYRQRQRGGEFVTMALTMQDARDYYHGYSNNVLWPACHDFPELIQYGHGNLEGYRRVNRQFSDKLTNLLRPDDLVWVHDYHLIPMARSLRQNGVRNRIGFFLHVPFPNAEISKRLPGYDFLLDCLDDYDLVGFQTIPDLEAYRATRSGSRRTEAAAGVFPVGIDVDTAQRDAVAASGFGIRTAERPAEKFVIGADRLDYSKGLPQRINGYGRFLEQHRGKPAGLLQIAAPSRPRVSANAAVHTATLQAARCINARFGSPGWQPVEYLGEGIPNTALMGLMRAAAVGLVTPLRDGMNLVAKEYVAAQDFRDPGVLVLSKQAGAAQELTDAILVDANDPDEIGAGIASAIAMPLCERQRRHASMVDTLRRNDVHAWRDRFLAALRNSPSARSSGRNCDRGLAVQLAS